MTEPRIGQVDHTSSDGIAVHGCLHLPKAASGDALILTHGAGANCQSPFLTAVAVSFADAGLAVLCCDLPFRQLRSHGPPPRGSAARDQQGLRAAVDFMRARGHSNIFLGGHSYGGRQATMLAAADPALVSALVLFSYPLHPPRNRTELRTSHFPSLRTPALFVHGTRDGFGSTEEVAEALKLIPAPTRLFSVTSAGHELLTSKNRHELPGTIVAEFTDFLSNRSNSPG